MIPDPSDRRRSNDVVIELIQSLRAEVTGQHERTNDRIRDGIAELSRKMDLHVQRLDRHEKDDLIIEKRVTVIEVERAQEQKQAMKQSTLMGALAAASFTGLVELLRRVWK